MKELPGPKKERLWDKKWVVEALNVVPALGTAVVAALMAAADASRRPYFGVLAALAAALGMASLVKVLHARGQDIERKRPEDHIGLHGALHVLHAVVRREGGLGEGPDDRLRVTIHRVVHEGKPLKVPRELEQMLPYICRTGGGQHRRFRIESGIIGKAARECALFSASRESTDFESAVRELVSDWAYTDAGRTKAAARPLVVDGHAGDLSRRERCGGGRISGFERAGVLHEGVAESRFGRVRWHFFLPSKGVLIMAKEKSRLADAFAKTKVVSKPGAAIRAERTELTGVLRDRLTTSVRSLGGPTPARAGEVKSAKP